MATALKGKELMRAAVNQILDHPETWNQRNWHCKSAHCIAGHCQIMSGNVADDNTCYADAREALGLSRGDADWLFAGNRSLNEIYGFAKTYLSDDRDAAGYNRAGYDRDGYNRAGYDRDGYDRDGYNRAGYDRDGYNRAGYDRDGYNRAGYNPGGYNRAGYNRAGYDRDGYDRDGYNRAGEKIKLERL